MYFRLPPTKQRNQQTGPQILTLERGEGTLRPPGGRWLRATPEGTTDIELRHWICLLKPLRGSQESKNETFQVLSLLVPSVPLRGRITFQGGREHAHFHPKPFPGRAAPFRATFVLPTILKAAKCKLSFSNTNERCPCIVNKLPFDIFL